jgi:hypothetical protein
MFYALPSLSYFLCVSSSRHRVEDYQNVIPAIEDFFTYCILAIESTNDIN